MKLELKDARGTYRFHCKTEIEVTRAQTLFIKEAGTIAWLNEVLQPGDVFWDVGANIGLYTIFAARRVSPEGRVIAFEPHAVNCGRLLENVAANALDNVEVLPVALADHPGYEPFNYKYLVAGSSGSQLGHTLSETGEAFAPVAVALTRCERGDDLMSMAKWIPPPTVIKIDVDGNEAAVLDGLEGCLRLLVSCRSIQVEVHRATADLIDQRLAACGFAQSGRHHTMLGQAAIDAGYDAAKVFYNAIYTREEATNG